MNRRALIIGVDKTGQLPQLLSAVQSALDFKGWADSQGIESTLLIDDEGPVTVAMVSDAVKKYVEAQNTDQLIVYFSGHGLLKGPLDEYWLLSEAPDDANAAVCLQTSRFSARCCGIPHVVFISDACRSVPSTYAFMGLRGAVIFNAKGGRNLGVVDMLYATAPGDPAYEIAAGGPQFACHSVYTRALLEGLHGKILSVRESYYKNDLVMARKLSDYLQKHVPKAAAQIDPLMRQTPDAEVTSIKPLYLSSFKKPPKEKLPSTEMHLGLETEELVAGPGSQGRLVVKSGMASRTTMSLSKEIIRPKDPPFLDLFMRASEVAMPAMHTGFAILGISGVLNENSSLAHIFRDPQGIIFINLDTHSETNTFLLKVRGGHLYPLAILPGFIGTLIFEKGILINVNYTPSQFSNRYVSFQDSSEMVIRRRALIASQSRNGTFRISGSVESLREAANYYRGLKALDPTLGLYASYAYLQAGDIDNIESVYRYMIEEPEPVLFDVALLAGLSSESFTMQRLLNCTPVCPMLTQGWSYLASFQNESLSSLMELTRFAVPGLWTAFKPEAEKMFDYNTVLI